VSKQGHRHLGWRELGVGLGTAILGASAGWGTVEVEHPPAPTPVCVQVNGPVAGTMNNLPHLDERPGFIPGFLHPNHHSTDHDA